jgi:hypothetical protein
VAICRLIIPLLNSEAAGLEVPTLFLLENIAVKIIDDEDFTALCRDAEELYRPLVSPKTLCVYLDNPAEGGRAQSAISLAARIQFTFKTFSASPILISHAAIIEKEGNDKPKLKESLELSTLTYSDQLRNTQFRFNAGTSSEQLHDWFVVVSAATSKHEPVHITLSRFNSALIRTDPFDKIIDVTISMESLIKSVQELKFKFALFHAFICEADPTRRFELFEQLQILYDARSSIVHGDTATRGSAKKIAKTVDHIEALIGVAQRSISYYLSYLYANSPDDWQDHLEGLVLGTEQRIG